ncbi:MAG TPA: hypothetical protein VK618_01855 [Flavitalea sp.]|nr:hypothetical protein [Flavitalea sp.]
MDKFLQQEDQLGVRINSAATELYEKLRSIDPDGLGMPGYCLHYYKASHSRRLFFSIETSASLLYRAIRMINGQPEDLVVMDYGGGVGSLYLLAKMVGFKQVIYNDHLEDWKLSAELIAQAIGIHIDHYIVGDIDACFDRLDKFNIRCDLITSRNVIEHIYQLDVFYKAVHERQPSAVVVSSTTANIKNPLSAIKHRRWHRKWEKVYRGKRSVVIERQCPGLTPAKINSLAYKTRGLASIDLVEAIENYRKTGKFPDPEIHKTNTCDPSTGVWAEHLLSIDEYKALISDENFEISFEPGFWDTHYPSALKNRAAHFVNRLIRKNPASGMKLTPFIYVIARPR